MTSHFEEWAKTQRRQFYRARLVCIAGALIALAVLIFCILELS